ncbi:MAG: hypothetical protein QOG69_473 [Actinomycetota bacterium]|jgi:hypothetical protein|nr:hypothetical protein [Actinomycetota bacterium]MDQ1540407.1 hypothetical protein [Actinomycetota bacterium]
MRVEAGAVVDEFDLPGVGRVVARHTRMKSGDAVSWACMFTVVASASADLAIVHRLSAPTLAEARRSVRHAVDFLAGRAAASSVGGRRQADFGSGPGRDPSVTALDLLNRTPDPQRGVVPAFDLGADRTPTDHLPAPLS